MSDTTTTYYAGLAAAMNAVNDYATGNGATDSTGAKVEVNINSYGTITVTLLEDDAASSVIEVQRSLRLRLGDKTLTFSGNGSLNLAAGTNVTISGGRMQRTVTENDENRYLVTTAGQLTILGGTYEIDGYHPDGFLAISALPTCSRLAVFGADVSSTHGVDGNSSFVKGIQTQATETLIKNCNVTTEASGISHAMFGMGHITIEGCNVNAHSRDGNAKAAYSRSGELSIKYSSLTAKSDTLHTQAVYVTEGTATVENSSIYAITYAEESVSAVGIEIPAAATVKVGNTIILADAKGCSALGGPMAIAISNYGTAFLENVTLNGTHSGVQNRGKLYVHGGDYTGFCHGGFYFSHGPEGEAYVYDATIRGGHYEGIFDYSGLEGVKYGCAYIGGGTAADNITAYLDGCTFDASDCHRSIILRGSSGEQNNTINISNSYIDDGVLDDGTIRIDNATLKLNVGVGTNINSSHMLNRFRYPAEDGSFPQYDADYEATGVVAYTGQLYRKCAGGAVLHK